MSDEETAGGMAEDGHPQKKKIDLKSRLSGVRGTNTIGQLPTPSSDARDQAAFPPPPTGSSAAGPMLPSFAPSTPSTSSSPFAPPEPEVKVSAQQQTIKVEMGEEIVEERARSRKKTGIYVVLAAVVCLGAGWQIGMQYQKGKDGKVAVRGAKGLATEVEAANKVLADLSDALRAAVEKLSDQEFPDDLADKLKSTNVPFSTASFSGKNVGRLPSAIQGRLFSYAMEVGDLNEQKDKLKNLLGHAKPAVLKFVAQKKDPVINFSIVFTRQSGNVVAQLSPNAKPFKQKQKKWPLTYEVLRPDGKKSKKVKVKRYVKGDVLRGDDPIAIPMSEKSVSVFTSRKLIFALRKALSDTKKRIDGFESNIPALQKNGLLKDGTRLLEALKKAGAAGG